MRALVTRVRPAGLAGWVTAVLAAALVAVAGCNSTPAGGEHHDGVDLTAPTSTSPATTAAQDERAAVVTAYEQFWVRHSRLRDRPESMWDDVLAAVAVDPQLSRTLQGARFNREKGKRTYGEVTTRVSDVDIDGDTATVVDCQDTSNTGLADAETGKQETVGVERNPTQARMERDPSDGQWKVAEITYPGGEC